ncbi:hypothetical protein OG689_44655 [Kitasatospora sp. NBC_00240]|uniref:hypothetical protein n=1 Tax=Kitasatospora sp. NBC_00240 TaxID=2903567 RepID=UPI0022587BAF|nr:hypothetical protein [Kitasatospora sp. NBC_00240]MCX5216231.1 hypothetical protein [Kitasatospora sp. NBC_00240]
MQQRWVYKLRDCPDREDVETLSKQTGRPRHVLARRRKDGDGLADGYVLQWIDAQVHTAVYSWIQSGDPQQVTDDLLQFLTQACPDGGTR